MSTERRLTIVKFVALAVAVVVWICAFAGLITVSAAIWLTLAVGVAAFVGARFRKHAELPGSVKLH